MVVQKFPEERLPENKSLLNRQSKNALKQLKVGLDPSTLYSLQLGDVAIEKGLYLPRGSALQESIHLMYGWKPKEVQAFIEQSRGEEVSLYPKTPGKPPNPEDLADAILQSIENKMSAPSGSTYPASIPRYLRE